MSNQKQNPKRQNRWLLIFFVPIVMLSMCGENDKNKDAPTNAAVASGEDTSAYKHFTELVSYFKTDDSNNIDQSAIPFGLLREILADEIDTLNEISIRPVKMFTNKYGDFFIVKVACYAGGFCDTYHLLSFNSRQHFTNSDIIGMDAGEDDESMYFGYAVDTDTSLRIFEIKVDNYNDDKKPDTTTKTLILK